MLVLGLDPGKAHTAYALVRRVHGRNVYTGSACLPMWEDLLLAERLPRWRTSLQTLIAAYEPSLVVAERYVPRPGMSRGAPAESINLYLGILAAICLGRRQPFTLVMPSVHKGYYLRTFASEPSGFNTPHEADAFSLAAYGHKLLIDAYLRS